MITLGVCLWYDDRAAEAAEFYASVFKGAVIGEITHFTKEGFEYHGKPDGSVMTVEMSIMGRQFILLNGDPSAQQCGWLKDKFGVSWQVSPANMGEIINGTDHDKNQRALKAMFTMKKLDIAELKRARS